MVRITLAIVVLAACTPSHDGSSLQPGEIAFEIDGVPAVTKPRRADPDKRQSGRYVTQDRYLKLQLHGNSEGQDTLGDLNLHVTMDEPAIGTFPIRASDLTRPMGPRTYDYYYGDGTLTITAVEALPPSPPSTLKRWQISGSFETQIPARSEGDRPPLRITNGRLERIEVAMVHRDY